MRYAAAMTVSFLWLLLAMPAPGGDGACGIADPSPREIAPPRFVQPLLEGTFAVHNRDVRLASIPRLEALVERGLGGNTGAEMNLQLADLHLRQGTYEQHHGEPNAMLHFAEAERLLELVVRETPGFPRVDRAWFLLGLVRIAQEHPEAATEAFEQLVERHPQSKSASDAHLMIGEHRYRAERNLPAAISAYAKAAGGIHGDYAAYMLARARHGVGERVAAIEGLRDRLSEWTDYGSLRAPRATAFALLLQYQSELGVIAPSTIDTLRALGPAAILADALDRNGQSDAARQVVEARSKELRRTVMRGAGSSLEALEELCHLGLSDEASEVVRARVETLRRTIANRPTDYFNVHHQLDILKLTEWSGNHEDVLREILRLDECCGPRTRWGRANKRGRGYARRWLEAKLDVFIRDRRQAKDHELATRGEAAYALLFD